MFKNILKMNNIKIQTVIHLEKILKEFIEEHKSNIIQGMIEGMQQIIMWFNEAEERKTPLSTSELIKMLLKDLEGVEWNLKREKKSPSSLSKDRSLEWWSGNKLIYQILIAMLNV